VVDDDTYSAALAELAGIANAAITQSQREMRASPVLQYSGVAVSRAALR
jgi:predicted component of type VI protein secretion system